MNHLGFETIIFLIAVLVVYPLIRFMDSSLRLFVTNLFPPTPEQRHKVKIRNRIDLIEEDLFRKLERFKLCTGHSDYKIRVQDPTNKVSSVGGVPVDYRDTMEIVLTTGEGADMLTSKMGIDLNDPRFLDDTDYLKIVNEWLDNLISSHINTISIVSL